MKHDDPAKAAQALREWERWHRRAADIGVAVPDATVLSRALTTLMQGVLDGYPEAAFRTSLVRNSLKLDTRPTSENVAVFHRHLLAEAEALATGGKGRSSSATSASTSSGVDTNKGGARLKGLQASGTADSTAAPKQRAQPSESPFTGAKPCRWFAKSEAGCEKGVNCPFAHEWGQTQKAGRCLVCSSTAHMKKDCPVKEKGNQPRPPKGKGDASSSTTSTQQQPAAEPAPTTSPTTRQKGSEGAEQAEDLKKMIEDASKMLKTMIASNAGATQSSSTSAVPTYESIQKQLDELKLKAMKVTKAATQEDDEVGVLLDSGSTHVLRPARSDTEKEGCKEVSVTLAGDEKRTLHQTPAGSIILGRQGKDEAQTIIPFGKLIEVLNCTVKWTRSGLLLRHPAHGHIKTRLRGGCPEITDAGQAAKIISELEMKKVEELLAKTASLRAQLNAIRMMEVRDSDWRMLLAKYVVQGKAVDGLQALYKSSIFSELPDKVRMSLVPEMDMETKSGWEYLKSLPMPRRTRKRLH